MDIASIFTDAAGFLTSSAGGGGLGAITGGIGAIVGGVFKYFQRRQDMKFEEKKWQHEYRLHELNQKAEAQENEHELAIVEQKGSWEGMSASQTMAASLSDNVHMWVNDARALVRVVLTPALWVLALVVFLQIIKGGLDDILGPEIIADLIRYMVFSVFYCASTATVWWYGDRMIAPPGMKNRVAMPSSAGKWRKGK